jgi:hypothetical protein
MLGPAQAKELIKKQLWPSRQTEKARLDRIDHWYRWTQEEIQLPRTATAELKALRDLSKVPWLGLVVTAAAQAMYVDGYRSKLDNDGDLTDSPPWQLWLANGMDRRQVAVHRYMLAYGYSFLTVLPGEDPLTGKTQAVMRGVSPRKMFALWDDPAEDDWPQYVDEPMIHGAGVCPVVRYTNMLDLDGRTPGEVEPFIAVAARINKTSYDRLLVQHFNSWKVRYVTGMVKPDDEEDANKTKLQLRMEDILVGEGEGMKFGTLDETQLAGFIQAHRADVETLAAASQTPTHELTGQMANLSAEALAAARASLNQKVTERQKSAGASHAQALRLASALSDYDEYATDVTGRVTWQDMEIRSMSQAADALGKMVQMLGVPPTATWNRIPGVEKSDVQEWVKLAEAGDPITKMQVELERQAAAMKQGADTGVDVTTDTSDPDAGN